MRLFSETVQKLKVVFRLVLMICYVTFRTGRLVHSGSHTCTPCCRMEPRSESSADFYNINCSMGVPSCSSQLWSQLTRAHRCGLWASGRLHDGLRVEKRECFGRQQRSNFSRQKGKMFSQNTIKTSITLE